MKRIAYFFNTFLPEVRAELAKVTFPTRSEVLSTTAVVIVASVIFAIFLWVSDMVIVNIYELAYGFLRSGV